MEKSEPGIFDQIEGLSPVDPESLADFKREMMERVIPEIQKVVETRQMLAAESRERDLEVLIKLLSERNK